MVENQNFFHGMTIKRAATRAINIMDYYDWGILEIATERCEECVVVWNARLELNELNKS